MDGVGVLAPANPLGVIPSSGHWSLTVTLPAFGPISIPVRCEAYIVDNQSTNGLFFITNVDVFGL